MKISVYIPQELERPLRDEAAEAGKSPAMFVQAVVRQRLQARPAVFSPELAALAGSWADDRSAEEIVRDIEESRESSRRAALR